MRPPRIPRYRCYKPKNLGLVVLNGKQVRSYAADFIRDS